MQPRHTTLSQDPWTLARVGDVEGLRRLHRQGVSLDRLDRAVPGGSRAVVRERARGHVGRAAE